MARRGDIGGPEINEIRLILTLSSITRNKFQLPRKRRISLRQPATTPTNPFQSLLSVIKISYSVQESSVFNPPSSSSLGHGGLLFRQHLTCININVNAGWASYSARLCYKGEGDSVKFRWASHNATHRIHLPRSDVSAAEINHFPSICESAAAATRRHVELTISRSRLDPSQFWIRSSASISCTQQFSAQLHQMPNFLLLHLQHSLDRRPWSYLTEWVDYTAPWAPPKIQFVIRWLWAGKSIDMERRRRVFWALTMLIDDSLYWLIFRQLLSATIQVNWNQNINALDDNRQFLNSITQQQPSPYN